MITPAYALTATERVLPRLALDFTTASLDPRITFTRAGNTATVINSAGVITGVNADLPRFDYDPLTLVCKGLLIEEARTNALLNSLINGTNLSTQSVTVTAAARTLSFYGTGQIVLSGAHSATVVGTGAYPTRTTLTFTPSAGTLTLTVTGTVQYAQLELGSFATSFIPTGGASATRNADVATMTGTNFSDWFNASEGTFQCKFNMYSVNASNMAFTVDNGTTANRLWLYARSGNSRTEFVVSDASVGQASLLMNGGNPSANVDYNTCVAYKQNSFAGSRNAGVPVTDTSGTVPSVDRMQLGRRYDSATQYLSGWLQELNYWPQRLTDSEVQAFSK